MTYGFGNRHSIQLSYGRLGQLIIDVRVGGVAILAGGGSRIHSPSSAPPAGPPRLAINGPFVPPADPPPSVLYTCAPLLDPPLDWEPL